MALVNYNSDSDSENEAAPPSAAPKPPNTTAPKLVDRANPRKIIVNLPSASTNSDEPPAKRARTDGGGGGGRFSAFRSALPPPKKTVAPVAAARQSQPSSSSSSSSSAQPLPFSFFKTSAEAAFSREPPSYGGGGDDEVDDFGNAHADPTPDRTAAGAGMRMNLPAPKSQASQQQQGPSIPEGQKPESEVKLVGKPLMFRPLSVARKPGKKSGAKTAAASSATKPTAGSSSVAASSTAAATTAAPPAEAPKKKKVSLFSLGAEADEAPQADEPPAAEGGYQPLFEDVVTDPTTGEAVYSDYATYQAPGDSGGGGPTTMLPAAAEGASTNSQSLDGVADDLGLSAAARRELFGRGGSAAAQAATASRVINFNLDREYRTNEEMRASGELQAPARVVKGIAPGKHSLRQLVNAVQSQREALEESFAKNKSTQQEASSRYGWR